MSSFQAGDIAACYGTSRESKVIRFGTFSPFAPAGLRLGPSHIAMLCIQDGGPLWVESTSLCEHACVIARDKVSGVQAHEPEVRIRDYTSSGGRVVLYRLSPIDSLSSPESELLERILVKHFVERRLRYDYRQAVLSGTRVLSLSNLFVADLEKLFCSELAAAVLMRLGRLGRGNPSRFNPSRLVRRLVRNGTYRIAREYGPESEVST